MYLYVKDSSKAWFLGQKATNNHLKILIMTISTNDFDNNHQHELLMILCLDYCCTSENKCNYLN